MKIGGIDTSKRVMVVAEAGNNHEGSLNTAMAMVAKAAEAGADAIKFQTIVPERLVAPDQAERIAQLKRFQLSRDDFRQLADGARAKGLIFLSTPFDVDSALFLDDLVPAFKISSPDNNFYPLVEAVASTGKPLLLSTGMSDRDQVYRTLERIRAVWRAKEMDGEIALLHCVSSYPTPPYEANLSAITGLASLSATVGYSDHTLGIKACVLAVATGARIIEKHFTLDKRFSDFRDHQLSADPDDLAELVCRVREAEELLGSGDVQVMPCEYGTAEAARRSLVAARPLKAGSRLQPEDLDWLRPGGGVAPGEEQQLLGKTLRKDIKAGQLILAADLD